MRAFIAVDLDASIRKALGRSQDQLRALAPNLKYVTPSAIHLTLKFLGDIDPRALPEISTTLNEITADTEPFEFTARRLGHFADRSGRIRVVWAGIEETEGTLARLQERIDAAMIAIGFPPDSRPFSPHLTLARARRPMALPAIVQYIQQHGDTCFGDQYVEEIIVYESTLTRDGPVYNAVSTCSITSTAHGD